MTDGIEIWDMHPDDQLVILESLAAEIEQTGETEEQKKAARMALTHVLTALASDETAFSNGVEILVADAGELLAEVNPEAGKKLSEFSEIITGPLQYITQEMLYDRRGISSTPDPRDRDIYELLAPDRKDRTRVREWLITP